MSCDLALETSANLCSVALLSDTKILVEKSLEIAYGHPAVMMEILAKTYQEANVDVQTTRSIFVNMGPGSFTGIRFGASLGLGLSVAANKTVLGLSSFQVHWVKSQRKKDALVVLDTRRRDAFYVAFFHAEEIAPKWMRVLSEEELDLLRKRETSADMITDIQSFSQKKAVFQQISASDLGQVGQFFLSQNTPSLFFKSPFYLDTKN